MGFRQFCQNIATDTLMTISVPADPNVVEIPYNLESHITVLTNTLRPMVSRFDNIRVRYVEACFEDMTKVFEILDQEYAGDIDDNIAYALSVYLFDKQFNDLDVSDQAIIKVLTIYLLVQNKLH